MMYSIYKSMVSLVHLISRDLYVYLIYSLTVFMITCVSGAMYMLTKGYCYVLDTCLVNQLHSCDDGCIRHTS